MSHLASSLTTEQRAQILAETDRIVATLRRLQGKPAPPGPRCRTPAGVRPTSLVFRHLRAMDAALVRLLEQCPYALPYSREELRELPDDSAALLIIGGLLTTRDAVRRVADDLCARVEQSTTAATTTAPPTVTHGGTP